ncbi:MAG: hypothetical protein OEQ25_14400, partial [Gammaproteobacteria bacterium]|nr:hypothetical protein [Gammaproteobacteria bacterium]
MTITSSINVLLGRRWISIPLALMLLTLASLPAQAQDCSDFGGVLDGAAGDIAPSQLQIDQNCTIRNYP